MPEKRTLEERYSAFLLNTVETITACQAGEKVTYCTKAGSASFVEPETIISPTDFTEAKTRAVEHVRRILDFDWSKFNA